MVSTWTSIRHRWQRKFLHLLFLQRMERGAGPASGLIEGSITRTSHRVTKMKQSFPPFNRYFLSSSFEGMEW